MLRKLAALAVGGILAAAVYGAAASLNVADGTAATGSNSVNSCGDVTGSTYLLHGTGISCQTDTVVTGSPSDIAKVTRVNIETQESCIDINFFVQLQDSGGGNLDGVGFCEATASGGLGFDEASDTDNTPGCTVDLDTEVDVLDIAFLVVTQT